jgi:L-asparaginase
MPRRRHPVLCLHGGTGAAPTRQVREVRRARLRRIFERAYEHLHSHSALETVAFAVALLEDDPAFNAGTGSTLQRDGVARMSASIMDGPSMRLAGVANIERVRNPVLVAQALLDGPDRILAGPGATRVARRLGFGPWDPVTAHRRAQWQTQHRGRHGTVGAVALDAEGRLAAATSTGGKGYETPGRVSDSCLPSGNYATTRVAVSCTGMGEHINEEGVAVRIAQRVEDGATLAGAMARTFRDLRARDREAGGVAVDAAGRLSWRTTCAILYGIGRSRARRVETF